MIENEEENELVEENTQESVDELEKEREELKAEKAKYSAMIAQLEAEKKAIEEQARAKTKKHAEEAATAEPNQSGEKGKILNSIFITENVGPDGAEGNNVAFKTAEEVSKFGKPVQKHFDDERIARKTSPLSSEKIVIEPQHEYFTIILRCGLHVLDVGNGISVPEFRKNLEEEIEAADPEHNKVVLIFGGGVSGSEWKPRYLRNAKVVEKTPATETTPAVEAPVYSGVNKRELVASGQIIRPLLKKYPNIEIYLMDGAEESDIKKYLKYSFLGNLAKRVNHPHLHYIPGVNTVIPVERRLEDGGKYLTTIGVRTNQGKSRANTVSAVLRAIMQNSGPNAAKLKFSTNVNIEGKLEKDHFGIGQSSDFKSTPIGKKPSPTEEGCKAFCCNIVGNDMIEIIQGPNYPKMTPEQYVEQQLYLEVQVNKACRDELTYRFIKQTNRKFELTPKDVQKLHNGIKRVKAANRVLNVGGDRNGNDLSKV